MNNFWIFLDAMAGVLTAPTNGPRPVDNLRRELLQMPEAERVRIAGLLNTVARGLSDIAKLDAEELKLTR